MQNLILNITNTGNVLDEFKHWWSWPTFDWLFKLLEDLLARYQLYKLSDQFQYGTVDAFFKRLRQAQKSLTLTYFLPNFQGHKFYWKAC